MAARKKNPKKPAERNLTRELSLLLAKRLLPDLSERVRDEPAVRAALGKQFEREKRQGRTADNVEEWTARTLEQVGVAWILSCVFIRTLEDRGYLMQRRLAGEGASDSEHVFFELFPSLTQRDYLLAAFRELSRLPGGEDVLGPKHNPAWRLSPSTEVVRELLGFFREANAEGELVWHLGGSDTRFLGDLYQDISEGVRERYALLQTPGFVEAFILDLTLEPAIQEFGLEEVRLLDPTCGSGHFLLGAFRHLFEALRRKAPGVAVKEHAGHALGQVYGVDINPYAVAIARFRLVLAYLEAAQIEKLRNAPRVTVNVVVADSLLFAADEQTLPLASRSGDAAAWGEEHWQLDDPKEAQRVFSQRFQAVVGNPPYITCKDPVLREKYRGAYVSAAGKFALAAPFTERFFQLTADGGFVGMINANSFIKREFGKKLIEEVLPRFDLSRIIDTSSADIPGHGTPTLLLFGRNRPAIASVVRAVLGKRSDPDVPLEAEKGRVWSAIRAHFDELTYEDEFISVADAPREMFLKHPWSFASGKTAAIKALLESRSSRRLKDLVDAVGIGTVVGEDEAFTVSVETGARYGLQSDSCLARPFIVGEHVRDWSSSHDTLAVGFYSSDLELTVPRAGSSLFRRLWPLRTSLWSRAVFSGETYREAGRPWYEWHQLTRSRYQTDRSLVFAFVATHNHFVLDRGGSIFNRSAPIVKLPPAATEEDHLQLLAYLNSSLACVWMKQVLFQKSSANARGDARELPERISYEFSATQLLELPVPSLPASLVELARRMEVLAARRKANSPKVVLAERAGDGLAALRNALRSGEEESERALDEMKAVQNAIDQAVYEAVLTNEDATQMSAEIERPMFKRPWRGTQGVFHRGEWTYAERTAEAASQALADELEGVVRPLAKPISTSTLIGSALKRTRVAATIPLVASTDEQDGTIGATLRSSAVPYLAAFRYSEVGLSKRSEWEAVWAMQRREDTGESLDISVPRKYDSKDYSDTIYWQLRGKLDISTERFISYPGVEKDDDPSPLYGWAGWDHLQQTTALAGLYHERKTDEGWSAERLVPILAGLLELVPWLKQWHNDPTEDLGGEGAGDWYERYVEAEARALGKSLQDLRDWRPPRGRKK